MPFNLKIEDEYNKFANIKLVPHDISNLTPYDLSFNNIEYTSTFNWYKPNMNDNDNISDNHSNDNISDNHSNDNDSNDNDLNDNDSNENNCYLYETETDTEIKNNSYKYNLYRNSLCPYSCKIC